MKYILNCFLLLIPIFVWNILFYENLPDSYGGDIFWKDIPSYISCPENILRIVVFALPVFMPLSFKTKREKAGLLVYFAGLLIYFCSWLAMIFFPQAAWTNSMQGFMAPAYTTIILFIGIGLIGNKAFFKFPRISTVYIILSLAFVIFHTWHTYVVYCAYY